MAEQRDPMAIVQQALESALTAGAPGLAAPARNAIMLIAMRRIRNSLSEEMQRHLLADTEFVNGTFGPLGTLTGDVYRLLEDARAAKSEVAAQVLLYMHERICRARHEISGDEFRTLPPRPTFQAGEA